MKIKVLYLDHTSKLGGAEFALLRFLKAIDLAAVEPVVLFADEGPAPEMFRSAGIETHVLPLNGNLRELRKDTLGAAAFLHPGRILGLAAYVARVARFAKDHRVEIIHTNSMKAHFYGGAAGRLAGLPVVWHIRDFINDSYLPAAAVHMVRFLARIIPSHVITVSRSVMDQIHYPERSKGTVVLDGLTDQELEEADGLRKNGAGSENAWRLPVRIGIVGRLAPWKGQHIFLNAAARMISAGHSVRFLIVGAPMFGEHDYEKLLRIQAQSLGITRHVEFLGFRKDVPDIRAAWISSSTPAPRPIPARIPFSKEWLMGCR